MKKRKDVSKKELIYDAAVQVIAENGYYNTSISQIASQADIAVGTIYNYFDCKEEILEYIFSVELKKRIRFLDKLKEKDLSFWEKITLFLENHFSELEKNNALSKILVREKDFPHSKRPGAITEYMFKVQGELEHLIEEAIQKGEIKQCNTQIISGMLFGAIQGLVEKGIKNKKSEIFAQIPSEMIKVFKNGLKNEK
ncbi:MAG: TetR/AcrR family transcriptional regulator [Bacillota bacterium]